jgi:hypothetical protein
MALYRTNNNTWGNLTGNTWGNCFGSWPNPLNTASGNVTVTSEVTDLGQEGWVWPTTTIDTAGIGNLGATISYQTSTDNSTFTSAQVGPLYGRYFTTVIQADTDALFSVFTEYNTDITTKTFQDLNSATLTGNTSQRRLDVSDDFSKIFGVVLNSSGSEANIIIVDIANTATSNLAFTLRNVDTYGKVAVDGNVNITITGYPSVELDTTTGTVRRTDNAT